MLDLVLIPFAGGSSLIYEDWKFDSYINPIRIDYKGHGFRISESLYDSFEEMVKDVAVQIIQKKNSESIAIFGHSMGGLVTWDVANYLVQCGCQICQLIISACLPPHLFKESLYNEMATDEWLNGFLINKGRINPARMDSVFFKKRLYPAIKNDYRLISTHKHENAKKVGINLACLYGEQDMLMPCNGMEQWKEYTEKNFVLKSFQGEHFYIEDVTNRKEIIATIESLI